MLERGYKKQRADFREAARMPGSRRVRADPPVRQRRRIAVREHFLPRTDGDNRLSATIQGERSEVAREALPETGRYQRAAVVLQLRVRRVRNVQPPGQCEERLNRTSYLRKIRVSYVGTIHCFKY